MCHSGLYVAKDRLNISYTEGEINHILFEDESMIRDYQAIQKTWFIKGKQ